MPPLLADFTHARVCKPFCEKYLTLPTTITRALDMAMLVIKVLDNHYNGSVLDIMTSVYGSLKVEKLDTDQVLITELNNYLDANRSDIQAHIKLLKDAINAYKE